MRIRIPFITKPQPETVEQNARRFAAVVNRLALERRHVLCYPHAGFGGTKSEEYGWLCMLNPLWRARVVELLATAPVDHVKFTPPDDLDGWTFRADSTAPVPRIAALSLEDLI